MPRLSGAQKTAWRERGFMDAEAGKESLAQTAFEQGGAEARAQYMQGWRSGKASLESDREPNPWRERLRALSG